MKQKRKSKRKGREGKAKEVKSRHPVMRAKQRGVHAARRKYDLT